METISDKVSRVRIAKIIRAASETILTNIYRILVELQTHYIVSNYVRLFEISSSVRIR